MLSLWIKIDVNMPIRCKVRVATWRFLHLLKVGYDDVLTEHVEIQVVL